jgi:hypothetical protein
MICLSCKGSGIAPAPHVGGSYGSWMKESRYGLGVVCRACDGTGYRSERGQRATPVTPDKVEKDSIGKVMEYFPGLMTAQLSLHEALHVGNRLLIVDEEGETEFELKGILVSQMDMTIALAGWEVAIAVPRPVDPGARIYRISA